MVPLSLFVLTVRVIMAVSRSQACVHNHSIEVIGLSELLVVLSFGHDWAHIENLGKLGSGIDLAVTLIESLYCCD